MLVVLTVTVLATDDGEAVYVEPLDVTLPAVTVQLPTASADTVPVPFCVRVAPPGPDRVNTGVVPPGRPLAEMAMLPLGMLYATVAPAATAEAFTVMVCELLCGV